MGMGLDYIFREVCQEEWIEVVDASFGEMKRVHTYSSNSTRTMTGSSKMSTYVMSAVMSVEIIADHILELLIAGITLLYGLLKVDTWTRGYYSKRLFFGVPAAIILVMVLIATIIG